jgi:hypothetical protein
MAALLTERSSVPYGDQHDVGSICTASIPATANGHNEGLARTAEVGHGEPIARPEAGDGPGPRRVALRHCDEVGLLGGFGVHALSASKRRKGNAKSGGRR